MTSLAQDAVTSGTAVDLHDLQIETFEIETLSELGVTASLEEAAALDLTISTTSSTCSACCG